MNPIVAILGRPNVGKSTLFNRLVGRRLAIVDDAPGVTRDRHYAEAHLHGRNVTLIDTGGFDPESDDPLKMGIVRHARAAIEEADVVVCVLDGATSPTDADRETVKLLRRSQKPVIYVANKVDSAGQVAAAQELYELGIPDLLPVSAAHGRGTAELGAAIVQALPKTAADPDAAEDLQMPRVALLGRPNAGKSSLFNRLTGEERSLVDDRPGTTRDPVDWQIEFEGQPFLLVDTAGVRRRARLDSEVEVVSVLRALRAIERSSVVVLLCDAKEGVAEQDARLLGLCIERRRAVIVGLNKMDLLSRAEQDQAEEQAKSALVFANWVKLMRVSAKTGRGVRELLQEVLRANEQFRRRISTSELNRFFADVLERQPPPTHGGRAPRMYYITQAEAEPPVFVAMTNAPDHIKDSYKRFVTNQIRKTFGFDSVPITVHYRKKR